MKLFFSPAFPVASSYFEPKQAIWVCKDSIISPISAHTADFMQ